MPRSLSSGVLTAVLAQSSDLIVIGILTLDHPDLDTPIRLTSNGEDVVVDGDTYTASGFDFDLPDDKEEGLNSAEVVIPNVTQFLTPILRGLSGSISATLAIAVPSNLSASPPVFSVEIPFDPLEVGGDHFDRDAVTLTLTHDNMLETEFPTDSFTPTDFPGLF